MKLKGTIKETIRDMIEGLEPNDVPAVINTSFNDLINFHHGYGTHIRNTYSLWNNESNLQKDLYSLCREIGVEEHPDSCSHILIEQMWCSLILDNVDLANDENIRSANKEIIR